MNICTYSKYILYIQSINNQRNTNQYCNNISPHQKIKSSKDQRHCQEGFGEIPCSQL